jgi:TonB family protein
MKQALLRILLVVLVLAGATGAASAQGGAPYAATKRAEASMLVTGSIDVTSSGTVRGYKINHRAELPAPVVELIDKNAPAWRFEPVLVDGHAVAVKGDMGLRVLAQPLDGEHYALSIRGAYFGKQDRTQGIRKEATQLPVYPRVTLEARAEGTVYLLLKVDPSGRVAEVGAEQTNLDNAGSEIQMRRWRKAFEDAAIAAAKAWTFRLSPSKAEQGSFVRVPVHFQFRRRFASYSKWEIYIPGPHRLVPWFIDNHMVSDNADALPGSGVFPVGSGLHLVTPLGGA